MEATTSTHVPPLSPPLRQTIPGGSQLTPSRAAAGLAGALRQEFAATSQASDVSLSQCPVALLHYLAQVTLAADNLVALNTHVTYEEWKSLGWYKADEVTRAMVARSSTYIKEIGLPDVSASSVVKSGQRSIFRSPISPFHTKPTESHHPDERVHHAHLRAQSHDSLLLEGGQHPDGAGR